LRAIRLGGWASDNMKLRHVARSGEPSLDSADADALRFDNEAIIQDH